MIIYIYKSFAIPSTNTEKSKSDVKHLNTFSHRLTCPTSMVIVHVASISHTLFDRLAKAKSTNKLLGQS